MIAVKTKELFDKTSITFRIPSSFRCSDNICLKAWICSESILLGVVMKIHCERDCPAAAVHEIEHRLYY